MSIIAQNGSHASPISALLAFPRWRGYDAPCVLDEIAEIARHIAADGTLEGLDGRIEPGDLAGAEAAYVDAFEPVPFGDPSWDEAGYWEPTLEERGWLAEQAGAFDAAVAPLPEHPDDEADWQEYGRWAAHVDAEEWHQRLLDS